jgi:cell wall-associated NlpC family hydrolase
MTRSIGGPLTPEESAAFVAHARSFLGVRFRHQGRNPEIGLDCAGLALVSMQAIGRPVSDLEGYGREPYRNGLEGALTANLGPRVAKESMRAGDVVMMRFNGDPRHVGILADYPDGGLMLIHTHDTLKRVREHRLDEKRAASIVAVWRP